MKSEEAKEQEPLSEVINRLWRTMLLEQRIKRQKVIVPVTERETSPSDATVNLKRSKP